MPTEPPSDTILSSPLLGGEDLRRALGFRTAEALRAALRSGRIPVPLMKIEGRKGWFARTEDLVRWQASLGAGAHNKGGTTTD